VSCGETLWCSRSSSSKRGNGISSRSSRTLTLIQSVPFSKPQSSSSSTPAVTAAVAESSPFDASPRKPNFGVVHGVGVDADAVDADDADDDDDGDVDDDDDDSGGGGGVGGDDEVDDDDDDDDDGDDGDDCEVFETISYFLAGFIKKVGFMAHWCCM